MTTSTRSILALAGSALLLGACAAGPYDYGYGYNDGYGGYVPGSSYDYPGYGYVAPPAVEFGLGFSDGGRYEHRREWRDEGHERHEQGRRHDRDDEEHHGH